MIIKIKEPAKSRDVFKQTTPYDLQFGFWGIVTEVHPEECSVHVRMSNGLELMGVKVASFEWVTVEKGKPLTGERRLPPKDSYVFCCMPNGEVSSAFVLCSGFAAHEVVHGDFKKKGEEAEKTYEKVKNSGWHVKEDIRTGTLEFNNKVENPNISLKIDQEENGGEKIQIKTHGTEIKIDRDGGVVISTDKKIKMEDQNGFEYKSNGDISLSSVGKISMKNNFGSLGGLIDNLLDYLMQLKTTGSPTAQSASPDFIANIVALKTKWLNVFK